MEDNRETERRQGKEGLLFRKQMEFPIKYSGAERKRLNL
jgi:hypothetical protein